MIDQKEKEEVKVEDVKINGSRAGGSGGPAPFSSLTTILEPHPRRFSVRRILLTLFVLAIVGAMGYGYWILRGQGSGLSQLSQLSDFQTSLATLRERMRTVEGAIRSWSDDRDAMYHRLAVLNARINRAGRAAREQSQKMVQDVRAQLEAELAKRDQVINARFSEVESVQQAQNEKVAALQTRLDQAQQEIASLRGDAAHQFASLHDAQAQSQTQIDGITHQLARQRVDFELAKNDTRELTPGVSLHVTGTDPRYQRYKGWLWYEPDRRFLWLESAEAQEPVVLRSKDGGEPYELVVTGVNRRGVLGYLLVPETPASTAAVPHPAVATGTSAAASGS